MKPNYSPGPAHTRPAPPLPASPHTSPGPGPISHAPVPPQLSVPRLKPSSHAAPGCPSLGPVPPAAPPATAPARLPHTGTRTRLSPVMVPTTSTGQRSRLPRRCSSAASAGRSRRALDSWYSAPQISSMLSVGSPSWGVHGCQGAGRGGGWGPGAGSHTPRRGQRGRDVGGPTYSGVMDRSGVRGWEQPHGEVGGWGEIRDPTHTGAASWGPGASLLGSPTPEHCWGQGCSQPHGGESPQLPRTKYWGWGATAGPSLSEESVLVHCKGL